MYNFVNKSIRHQMSIWDSTVASTFRIRKLIEEIPECYKLDFPDKVNELRVDWRIVIGKHEYGELLRNQMQEVIDKKEFKDEDFLPIAELCFKFSELVKQMTTILLEFKLKLTDFVNTVNNDGEEWKNS